MSVSAAIPNRHETILIVDDDEGVTQTFARMLRSSRVTRSGPP